MAKHDDLIEAKKKEQKQFEYIQASIDYKALADASQVAWLSLEMRLTLENFAKVAKKKLQRLQKT